MKRLCLIALLLLGVQLCLKAPNLNSAYIQFRFETEVQGILEEALLQERISHLLYTIRTIESRNTYTLKGQSGEYGAYQFTKATWTAYCLLYFKEVLDKTIPENQDKVAEKKIKFLVKQGFTDEQIAAVWNSGTPKWEGKIGINKYGVKYNVPKYVRDFMVIKNKLTNYGNRI